jgi:hypothetical protein
VDAKYETEPVVTPELQAAINTTGLAPDATWSQKVNALVGNGLTAPLDAAYAATVVTAPLVDYSANPTAAPGYAPAHLLGQPAPVSDRLAAAQAAGGVGALAALGATPVVVKAAPEVVSSFQCAYCGKTLTFTVSAAKA